MVLIDRYGSLSFAIASGGSTVPTVGCANRRHGSSQDTDGARGSDGTGTDPAITRGRLGQRAARVSVERRRTWNGWWL